MEKYITFYIMLKPMSDEMIWRLKC